MKRGAPEVSGHAPNGSTVHLRISGLAGVYAIPFLPVVEEATT